MNLFFFLQVVVLSVGTNNVEDTPQEITEGIIECVKVISSKRPQPYVVVLVCILYMFESILRANNRQEIYNEDIGVPSKWQVMPGLFTHSRLEAYK